jgi:HD-GYP domain-containing protein (c-di-GMP phosphodiesterase class II)
MVLAVPIYHPRRQDTILLKDGITLDSRSIGRLREINLRECWIRYPGVGFISEYICPAVFEAHAGLTRRISEAFELVSTGTPAKLEYNTYRGAISSLMDRLIANPRAAVFVQEMVDRGSPVLAHASTVSFLAVLMGMKLDDYLIIERTRVSPHVARDVAALGVGAMFHDLGMLRLDPEIVERWNRTLDETNEPWRAHVQIGYDLVKEAIGPASAAGILHHHQKFDGTGFPRRKRMDGKDERLAGSEIHVFARIIAAADLFDRLRNPPGAAPDAGPVPVVRVLKQLQQLPYAAWIDPMVFKALLAVVPAYLPGSIVTLNNGVQGVVTEWYPDDPCRPTVVSIGDFTKDFNREDRPVDRFILRDTAGLEVTHAEGQDVYADNFYATTPGQYDLKLAGRTLHNAMAQPLEQAG